MLKFARTTLLPQNSGTLLQTTRDDEREATQATQLQATTLSLAPEVDGTEDVFSIASAPPPVAAFAGVMLKGNKNDLARFFELPPTEGLRGDFHCALRKRVLLQGRMYIFDHYVCFYSAVFGFAKKRRVPMRTILQVKKKSHLGFPNSLEIESDDRKDFYTSFLSREEAYQLMARLVPEAKRLAASQYGRPSTDTGSLAAAGTPRGGLLGDGYTPDPSTGGASPVAMGEIAAAAGGGDPGSNVPLPRLSGVSGSAADGSARARNGGGHGGGAGAGGGGRERPMQRSSGSMVDDDKEDEDDEEGAGVWTVQSGPAPPLIKGARHLLHSVLPGTPKDFYDAVLADNAPFLEDFLESQGNRRVNLSTWKRHPQLGHVRDLHFTAPIKGAFGNWGVSHTACFQSHRFCLYSDEHIVYESSQTMTDIPYGDCFTVDLRWDIKRDMSMTMESDQPQLSMDIHIRVPFTGRCLFKGVIESGSFKQVQETYTHFVEHLRPVLQERVSSRGTLHLGGPSLLDPAPSLTPRMVPLGSMTRSSGQPLGPHPLSLSSGRPLQPHGSLARSVSLAPPSAAMDGCESPHLGERSRHPLSLSVSNGLAGLAHSQAHEHGGALTRGSAPGVGSLLLSLGGRLLGGVRGLLEAGVDCVLNLFQANNQTTPQMRLLALIVLIMFFANFFCVISYMWNGSSRSLRGSAAVTTSSAGGSFAAGNLGMMDGTGVAGGGGLAAAYWQQRMAVLQQEMSLLQGRLEFVSREVNMVLQHLTAATGGAAEGGAAAAAAAAGQEL